MLPTSHLYPKPIANFSSLGLIDSQLLGLLIDNSDRREAVKHQTVVRDNDPAIGLIAVLSGAVMLWKTRGDHRQQVVQFLFPGDLAGALEQDQYIGNARALTDCTFFTLQREKIGTFCDHLPAFQHALFKNVVNDLLAEQKQLVILGSLNAQERLAAGLLQIHQQQLAHIHGPADRVWLPMRRTDLASYLGLELATLSRAFSKLCRSGVIASLSMTEVVIQDYRRLQSMAGVT